MLTSRVPLAVLNLLHSKRRFVVALAGIAFAVLLMFMELGFWNSLLDCVVQLVDALNGELIIVSKAKYSLAAVAPFTRHRLAQARAIEGVRDARPVYLEYQLSLWKSPPQGDGGPNLRPIRVIAFEPDPDRPALDVPEAKANAAELRLPDRVLVDRRSRRFYGQPQPGTEAELSHRAVRVVDTFDLGTEFTADGNVITSDRTFARLFPHRLGADGDLGDVDVGVVQVADGYDPVAVQAALRAVLPDDVVVLTHEEFRTKERVFWQTSTPMGFVFLLGLIMGFVVGVIICYQILAADIADHLPEYATLKAIGYHNRYLTGVVFQEALLLALLGFVPGVFLGLGFYQMLGDWTGLPLTLTLFRGAFVLVLTVLMCFVSGLAAIRKVQTADPAEVFR